MQVRLRERVSSDSAHAGIRARLSDYLDGSLPAAELDDLRRHLDSCAACQAFWRTLLRLINTTGQLPRHSLTQAAKEHLLASLDRTPARS
jgi:anti-sigma factor RsiW